MLMVVCRQRICDVSLPTLAQTTQHPLGSAAANDCRLAVLSSLAHFELSRIRLYSSSWSTNAPAFYRFFVVGHGNSAIHEKPGFTSPSVGVRPVESQCRGISFFGAIQTDRLAMSALRKEIHPGDLQ